MVGNKDMATEYSMAVEFNEVNSEGNRGHSRANKGWRSLPKDSGKDVVSNVAP